MTILSFSCITLVLSIFAGIIGALTGLGGAIIIIPFMVLFLKINMHYAMGAGLFAVMATSMGTAMAFLREGYINIRIGMFLEVAAAIGAIIGASITNLLPANIVQIIFGVIFIVMAYINWKGHKDSNLPTVADPLATKLNLNSTYPAKNALGKVNYYVVHVISGFCMMVFAGIFSGLLGIGSGSLKVIAMDQAMRLPYKVSTSTSNFIIGITAAVSAGIFLLNGYINPGVTFPVVIGVLIGALAGARLMPILPVKPLRILFSIIILFLALQMVYEGVGGKL